MEDVARTAGVHQTTVSRALRNDRRLPESTRHRIKAIADTMGYRPNPLLSALGANLRQRRTAEFSATLAYIVRADAPSERRREHFAGAGQAAGAQGYRLEEFVVGSAGLTPERLNDILLTRNVQGVIIGPLPEPRGTIELRWDEFCAVSIELTLTQPLLDRVVHDNFSGMRAIMQQCRSRGYRRPGLVLTEAGNARTEGLNVGAYLLEQRGGVVDALAPLLVAAWSPDVFSAWFRTERPDVIITSNALTESIQAWCAGEGLAVGRDLGFVNVNALPEQSISGVQQAWDSIGAIAAQLVIDKINRNDRGAPALYRTILTPGTWCEGTTLPARS
ncbi:MAG: LacI family DNA-binding transcriptional regulator [Opitutaceae bacterium]|nr:LacI family DNA-binding transcriptional regulator [Opitutaceae bacterium]